MIGVSCPTFTNFDEMCAKAKPDLLTVTTVDAFHAEHIVKALDRGIDVITEKPMVIDEVQCKAVLDAEKRNNRKIGVTFNYRYAPKHRTIKEALMAGEIGKVISVDFHWYLDVYHGADYFRRWHRLRSKGGSLWVHKATHHFDLINWWLAADPVEVSANCEPEHLRKAGRSVHQLPAVPAQVSVPVPLRHHDQREPDEAVRRLRGRERLPPRRLRVAKEDVNIFDSMSALVKSSNGATMTYSVNAFMPFEGYRLAFNGEKGRLEIRDFERQPWDVTEETENLSHEELRQAAEAADSAVHRGRPRRRRHAPARPDFPQG